MKRLILTLCLCQVIPAQAWFCPLHGGNSGRSHGAPPRWALPLPLPYPPPYATGGYGPTPSPATGAAVATEKVPPAPLVIDGYRFRPDSAGSQASAVPTLFPIDAPPSNK